jgi:hypothetical protein
VNIILNTITDNGSSVKAFVGVYGSDKQELITLWDITTTPRYDEIGDWNRSNAYERAKIIIVNQLIVENRDKKINSILND